MTIPAGMRVLMKSVYLCWLVSVLAMLVGCKTTPDAARQTRRLGRGINLGNALEAPSEGAWGVKLQPAYFDAIRRAGFDAIRLPIRWSAHAEAEAPYSIDPTFFERVDWAVRQALARDLVVVINVHHYAELMASPAAHKARYLALLQQIASRYRNYPDGLLLELLNEPNDQLTAKRWNALLAEAITTVRRIDAERTLIVGTAEWGGLRSLRALELPPEEKRLIVTLHYYEPFHFTHQGAEWVKGSEPWLGTTWLGTEAERQAVRDDLAMAAEWSRVHNRPLWIGEFGAYGKADLESRVRWTAFVAREAERQDMAWCYWEFGAGFGAYDLSSAAWREPLLQALVPVP